MKKPTKNKKVRKKLSEKYIDYVQKHPKTAKPRVEPYDDDDEPFVLESRW